MNLFTRRASLYIKKATLFVLFLFGISISNLSFAYNYYVVDPISASNNVTVYSQVDNNTIEVLDAGGALMYALPDPLNPRPVHIADGAITIPAAEIEQGYIISSSGEFSVGSYSAGGSLVPEDLLGKEFVLPRVNIINQEYHLYNPSGSDVNVKVQWGDAVGVLETTHIVPAYQVFTVSPGVTSGSGGRALNTSDRIEVLNGSGIAVSYSNDTGYLHPVAPAANEVWGIRSSLVAVGVYQDETEVQVVASDGSTQTFVLNIKDSIRVRAGSAMTDGQGTALRIYATDPDKWVAAVQWQDKDGQASTSFWPNTELTIEHATHYTLPSNTQYVAIACEFAGTTIRLKDDAGNVVEDTSCNSAPLSFGAPVGAKAPPGKAYLGKSTGTTILAGSTIESSKKIYLYQEVGGGYQNERNLLGFDLGTTVSPPTDISITTTNITTNNGPHTINGTTDPGNSSVNLYVNGNKQTGIVVNPTTGEYAVNNVNLVKGKNTIYTTSVLASVESLPSKIMAIHYVPADMQEYYVVHPNTAGNNITVYSQSEVAGNTIFAGGTSSPPLDKGDTHTFNATDLEQGDIVLGDASFSTGSYSHGGNLVPKSLLGQKFVMPHITGLQQKYYIFNPNSVDAVVSVDYGYDVGREAITNKTIKPGEVVAVDSIIDSQIASPLFKNSDVITSDIPVAVVYDNSYATSGYAYPVAPATTEELWGIKSQFVVVGAAEATTVYVESSEGGSPDPYILGAKGWAGITTGLSTTHGKGSSLHIYSNPPVPIAAVQYNDGDGQGATSLWPSSLHATHYTIPATSQYVAIACPQLGTKVVTKDNNGVVMTGMNFPDTCTGGAGAVLGKLYLGKNTGQDIPAGSTIEADAPFYLYHEVGGGYQDEQNLLGYIPAPVLFKGITKVYNPEYQGYGTSLPNAEITIYEGGDTVVDTTTADSGGVFYYALDNNDITPAGTYNITAVAAFGGGSMASEHSNTLALTYDDNLIDVTIGDGIDKTPVNTMTFETGKRYIIMENIYVDIGVSLNIPGGVVLQFAPDTGLTLRAGASLTIDSATQNNPVVFTDDGTGGNPWKGISIYTWDQSANIDPNNNKPYGLYRATNIDVEYIVVEGADSAFTLDYLVGSVTVGNSVIRNTTSGSIGVSLHEYHGLVSPGAPVGNPYHGSTTSGRATITNNIILGVSATPIAISIYGKGVPGEDGSMAPEITCNNIVNNSKNIRTTGFAPGTTLVIDAENNWWGTDDPVNNLPAGTTMHFHNGDGNISVDFDPFETTPCAAGF